MAAMAVRSIRTIGLWSHDIVLLSDTDEPLPGLDNVRSIDMLSAAKARYPWMTHAASQLHHLKSELAYHIDLTQYDYVLYLDCDVLVNSDRLVDLVTGLERECAIVVQQDICDVSSGFPFAGGRVLDREERRRWGAFAINSGIVGLPINTMGRRLLRDWRQLNVDLRFSLSDQGNLISLLLRQYYGQWGYVLDATMGRKLERYPQTFVHFTGKRYALYEAYYAQVLGLPLPAEALP